MHPSLDRPWRRPGALSYAARRIRAAVRPPVEVSPAPPDLVKDVDVPVRLRDGVILRLNVYRPPGAGPFPVVMCAHPYRKDALPRRTRRGWSINLQYRLMNQPEPVRLSAETSWEAPDPVWWVGQGYAVVNADTRGGGRSEGRGDLFSDQEAEDIAELIGWAGAQPWSTGRVGMLGVSYLAISQYKAAALHPPALRAICPWEGFTDAYRDFLTPGGVMETGFARIWLTMTRRLARVTTDLEAERRRHPLRDDWWDRLTPDLARITAPILVCTSFSDANLHSSGSMRAFLEVGSAERHAYTHRGPKWAAFYGEQARAAQLAFFERHLKQRADAAPLPRVRLEVRDRRDRIVEVRDEEEWPLARTRWTRLYLGSGGSLLDAPAEDCATTFDLRRNAARFDYRFREDTELTGPMTLRLSVSCTGTDDPRLFAGVEKWSHGRYVPFEGSYGYGRDRVASGRLRLALRELDPEATTPHRPEHTFRTLQPLAPGEPVEVTMALSPSATLFRAGDTLRLLVAGRDLEPTNPLFGHFPARYASSRGGTATLHSAPDRPAFLELPVIPARPA